LLVRGEQNRLRNRKETPERTKSPKKKLKRKEHHVHHESCPRRKTTHLWKPNVS